MAQLPVLNNVPAAAQGSRESLARGLMDVLQGRGEVRFGLHDRKLYSTDASLYQVDPIGVVVPSSVDDACRVVRWCGSRGVAMLPRGGGTSLAGQCTNQALVIDLTPACRAIMSIDLERRTCTVEPGIAIDELNDALAKRKTGLFFAPDPATTRQCAIGGAIGNNAAGARSILYGRTSENIESIDCVLATGERLALGPDAGLRDPVALRLAEGVTRVVVAHAQQIRERFPKTIRRNAGYGLDMILQQLDAGATPQSLDLSKLLCGSEGTLAMTLSAKLKLHPVPKAKGLALLGFDSVDEALAAVIPILQTGPSAVEMLDDVVLDAARGNEECRQYLRIMPKPKGREAGAILYVEYFGFDSGAEEVGEKFKSLRSVLGASLSADAIVDTLDAGTMNMAWLLRKAGEPLLHGLPGSRKPITFVEDNAVPVENLAQFVREFREIVTRHGTKAAYWAHASVGVLHVRPMIDIHDAEDRERMRAIAVEVADLAKRMGGVMSGEHGDGRVRGPLLERFFGPELMQAFREVKRLFDPQGLLNPGNIVSPGPIESITSELRVDQQQHVEVSGEPEHAGSASGHTTVETYYDYSETDGFAHAAEQCNGAGVCRKRGGVMCPSFHATLDERHSTRGRGNALRLAITGQFPESGDLHARAGEPNWSDPETIKTLDLCLSCKACKSECPSNVDIAKLKSEYTAQRFKALGKVPVSALATGYVRVLNQVGSLTPGAANFVNATAPARAIINRIMGIHPKRSLPKFSTSLYRAWQPRRESVNRSVEAIRPRVVLYTDCFTTYNESHVGVAAMRVLERLGYAPELSPSGCCGRSMISVGMLAQAISTIDATIERLRPVIEDDSVKAIVVCEPSCLSAIKDDWLSLKLASFKALRDKLASKAMLVEEFIERSWSEHPNRELLRATIEHERGGPKVFLHGHCHQKALWGAKTSAAAVARFVGQRLAVLDTGCCGMAGSFGYGQDKFELSMKIAELALLPLVRAADREAIILAPGTSCRHQVHDGAAREALHPIQFIDQILQNASE